MIEKALDKYPEGQLAREEARLVELGAKEWPKKVVDEMIANQLGENKRLGINWRALPVRLILMLVDQELEASIKMTRESIYIKST